MDPAPYTLTELTHPGHLVEEGQALNHCLGTKLSRPTTLLLSLPATDPRRWPHLFYWRTIKRGDLKLFSFGTTKQRLVTIDYDPNGHRIRQLSTYANGDALKLPERHRLRLKVALVELSTMVPISNIDDVFTPVPAVNWQATFAVIADDLERTTGRRPSMASLIRSLERELARIRRANLHAFPERPTTIAGGLDAAWIELRPR